MTFSDLFFVSWAITAGVAQGLMVAYMSWCAAKFCVRVCEALWAVWWKGRAARRERGHAQH